jgi:exodeoxyribonuclease VII small subunit
MAEQKFEDLLNKLERIVNDLEDGDIKLDEAIKKYEEGMKLSSLCNKKLNEIKKRIDVLVKDSSGNLIEKEFDKGPAK